MKQFIITVLGVLVGGFILLVLPFIMIIMFAGIASIFTPSNEKDNSLLIYDLSTIVEDRKADDPMSVLKVAYGENSGSLGLNQVIAALDQAASDDKISALMLTGDESGANYSTMKEILPYIEKFKESGKSVYYYNESTSQSALYLASAADAVYVMPEGSVAIYGLQSTNMFYKGALEKFGLNMQVIRHGKYKSAVEPYMLDKMSPASKEQTQRMVDIIWSDVKTTIAENRGIDPKVIDEYADKLDFVTTESALRDNLIDSVMYRDEFISMLKEELGVDEKDDINSISIAEYNTTTSDPTGSVAVIYAEGEINAGSNEGDQQNIYGDDLARTIRKARRDDKIKAIVLRVNSPGGSIEGSEVIWREVKSAAAVKPLVVSMGEYAASGGYYISCPADKIYAENTTLTGSIGVFGVVPCVEKAANSIGITFDSTKSNKSGMPSLVNPLDEIQMDYLQKSIEHGYATFIGHCASGRHTTTEHIDSIGQGRVWTGEDALKIGLVDEIGTLNDAIEYAAAQAELGDDYSVRELPSLDDSFTSMMKKMGMNAKASIGHFIFGETYDMMVKAKKMASKPSIEARMEYDIVIK
ncbi:MAG: signal peptide peptidase SppA [Bacteroidales bacterium]|nr:signal peptide peptidase SppA [Bacteroidales bacterium]